MLCYRLEVQPCLDLLYFSTNAVLDDIIHSNGNPLNGMPDTLMLFQLTQDIVGLCDFVLTPNMMPDIPLDWEPSVAARRYVVRILEFNIEHLQLCANSDTLRALDFLWNNWTAYLSCDQNAMRTNIKNERADSIETGNQRAGSVDIKTEVTNGVNIKSELFDGANIKTELFDGVNIKNEPTAGVNIKTELTDGFNIKSEPTAGLNIKSERANSVDIKTERTDNDNMFIEHDTLPYQTTLSMPRHSRFWTQQEQDYLKKLYREHSGLKHKEVTDMFNDHFRGKIIDGIKLKERTLRAVTNQFKIMKIKQEIKREESE